jgi:hypothetical protein
MMGQNDVRPCPCKSGKPSQWMFDCKGIALDRVCEDCEDTKRAKYNPMVFTGYTQADVDEQIEEDY